MMAVLATGERHAVQMGGYAVHDTGGAPVLAYGPGCTAIARGFEDFVYHSWFTRVPAGVDAEMVWALPPWVQVADLAPSGPKTCNAVADRGGELLPDWFWESRAGVRDRFGMVFSADRALTLRRVEGILSQVQVGVDYLRVWLELVCGVAARRLGLSMDGWTPLVPGSFMVGRRLGGS